MNDLITVMIPAYNAQKYIGRCIESLLKQTYQEIEVLIVNDGSKDNTRSICEEYAGKDARIRLINQSNGGEGAARNRGLVEARGVYLCFVDADDYVKDDFVASLYSLMRDNRADMSICGYTELKGTEILNETTGSKQVFDRAESMEMLLREDSFRGYVWNKMFRMDIIREQQLHFDESLAVWTDVLFVFQYMRDIDRLVYDPTPKYYYIYVENSASHAHNHVLGVEKSYSAIRAKNCMIDDIPVEYTNVRRQLSIRYVQSALAVIRNIGYTGQDYDYLDKCLEVIRTYQKEAYPCLKRRERILVRLCKFSPKLLLALYKVR